MLDAHCKFTCKMPEWNVRRTEYVFQSEPGSSRKVSLLTKAECSNVQRTRTWQINNDVREICDIIQSIT